VELQHPRWCSLARGARAKRWLGPNNGRWQGLLQGGRQGLPWVAGRPWSTLHYDTLLHYDAYRGPLAEGGRLHGGGGGVTYAGGAEFS
jgi:hypothetical protein